MAPRSKFVRVDILYEQHPEVLVKELAEACRALHQAMGDKWKDDQAPEHFTPRARWIFQYKQRTLRWRKFKKRMAAKGLAEDGGDTDLVYKGTARRLVHNASVNATRAKAVITHYMPRYFGKPPRPGSPDMRKEMLAISPKMDKELSEVGALAYAKRLRTSLARKRVVI